MNKEIGQDGKVYFTFNGGEIAQILRYLGNEQRGETGNFRAIMVAKDQSTAQRVEQIAELAGVHITNVN